MARHLSMPIPLLLLCLWTCLLMTACGTDPAPPSPPPLQAVTVVPAISGNLVASVRLSASLVARDEALVAAEGGSARMLHIAVDAGDRVVAGEELIRLDDASIQVRLIGNQADRLRAGAAIDQALAQVLEARAGATETRLALDRARQVAASGALSADSLDTRVAAESSAQARVGAAEAAVAVARADVERLAADRADIELALRRTRILAPVSGLVLSRSARLGAMADPGVAQLVIAMDGVIECAAEIPERLLAAVTPGRAVTVEVAGTSLAGVVRRVEPLVDAVTRLGSLRISLVAAPMLRPGMSAVVVLALPAVTGPMVPLSALQRRDGQAGVLVATPDGVQWTDRRQAGSVRRVAVRIAAEDSRHAVLADGLALGALVVAQAPDFVADGVRCVLVQAGE